MLHPAMSGGVRVGIEFVGLSETERALAAVLSAMNGFLVKS